MAGQFITELSSFLQNLLLKPFLCVFVDRIYTLLRWKNHTMHVNDIHKILLKCGTETTVWHAAEFSRKFMCGKLA